MLLGGPADGEVVKWDTRQDVLLWPEPADPVRWAPTSEGYFLRPHVHQYHWKRLATPDHWVQVCYVHTDLLDHLADLPASKMIAAIMEPWRAAHRPAAV